MKLQALRVVSNALANENYDQLEELVVPDVLEKIKQKISHLSYEQKQLIAVRDEDVCMSFPFDINLITKGEKGRIFFFFLEFRMNFVKLILRIDLHRTRKILH